MRFMSARRGSGADSDGPEELGSLPRGRGAEKEQTTGASLPPAKPSWHSLQRDGPSCFLYRVHTLILLVAFSSIFHAGSQDSKPGVGVGGGWAVFPPGTGWTQTGLASATQIC